MGVGDKIRVIIVDDIAESRENVRKVLQFESDFEVVGIARTGREGIDVARETKPDVVLMDINMPDMDGITATETIRKDLPYAQIVILSVQGDPNYMRRAMLAGARDFLTKPPSLDELTSAIRRAGRLAQEERSKSQTVQRLQTTSGAPVATGFAEVEFGKILVIYSPKGGTGCTTVATNLAIALHRDDTPVVLVDGNFQFGDVAVFINEQSKNNVVDLASRADELDPDIVDEVLLHHKDSGMKVLAAPPRPEYAESVTGEQFVKVLNYLRQMFAYVIVDTASALSDNTLAAFDACDLLLLLITQEIPAIKNARLFLDLADALGIPRSRMLFVMNKYDKRIGITPEKVGENFKHDVSVVLPVDERIVLPSINRGVPFIVGDKTSPLPRSLLLLAQAVGEKTGVSKTAKETVEVARMARR